MGRIVSSRRHPWRRSAAAGVAALALLTGYGGISHGSADRGGIPEATVRALEAINRTDDVPDVVQNLAPGALAARDADAGFYKPHAMVWVCPPGLCPT
jgi:hypothetical protein